jgi:hypothetical protein
MVESREGTGMRQPSGVYESRSPLARIYSAMAEYDSIASGYSDSKQLAFRDHVERYTLF